MNLLSRQKIFFVVASFFLFVCGWFLFTDSRKDLVEKGGTIVLGAYEQNGDPSDGPEPITWIVLDRIDDKALLLSQYCLDAKPYNSVPFMAVTWETSELRKWLNGDFYEGAFSDKEREMIRSVQNQNAAQSIIGTNGGNETDDRVFLLSETDMTIYMYENVRRRYIGRAIATKYAASLGNYYDKDDFAKWWLRSPGVYEFTAQFIDFGGGTYTSGANADMALGVRPAVWIDIKRVER